MFLTKEGVPQGSWQPLLHGYDRFSVLKVLPILGGYVATVETHIWEEVSAESGILVGLFSDEGSLRKSLISSVVRRENKRVMRYEEEKSHADLLLGVVDGRLVYTLGGHHDYRFTIYDHSGRRLADGDRIYAPWQRKAEEVEECRSYWKSFFRRYDDVEVLVSSFERSIYAVHGRPNQTVWIEHSRGWFDTAEGVALTFHAFDQAGRYLREIQLLGEISAEEDAAYVLQSGVVIVRAATSSWLGSVGAHSSTESEDDTIVFYDLIERER